ncbi:MAG: response regulator transcription factor [Muribaculaceae bacterium]|nr:response regulator transcription factor [Muribaculaceae bacterium]
MRIAVVDDHDLVREGLNAVLLNNGATKVDKFRSATELVGNMDAGNRYDYYVIDLELPDIDGFVLIEMVRARHPEAKIIVSTVHDEVWTLRKLLVRNVNAIIYKSGNANEILMAIGEIREGRKYYCEEVEKSIKTASDVSRHPSSRELQVLREIALGKTTREISATMFITENTVEAHRKSLFAKLGAVNVADLIMKAVEKGYITRNGSSR